MKNSRAIVIGGGFGGLALAIRLKSQGFKTLLLEKRDKLGGRAYVFEDGGFKFDAGPTVITAPHCLEELFQMARRKMQDYIELKPVFPFYRLSWQDGYTFDYSNDNDALKRQILQKSPADWQGYLKFLDYSKRVFDEGYTKLVHVPFLDFWSMVRCAPQLARLQAFRSVYSMVSQYIQDPQLREAFSFHSLLIGGSPFSSSSIYTLIHHLERNWGVFFPMGGTGALVKALGRLFVEIGGEVRTDAEVGQILTSSDKVTGVRLKDGRTFPADIVACNSDVAHAYRDLLGHEPAVKRARKKALGSSYSMSLFVLYFGTNKKYPGRAQHEVLFGPRYKGLLDDIFKKGRLADDFSLYLHTPTVTDPSLAPDGHEGFYVLSPVPHLGKANLDWTSVGPMYADRILSHLDQHALPGLKQSLVTRRIFTPLDFKTELNSHLGSAFSVEPVLTQSAYFRTHNRDPDLKGLYFVGAGTHPGAGVPGVVNSAKATAMVIENDFRPEITVPVFSKDLLPI
ncbi:MAG: phytoene desaturase [Bdellovibrionales bacterium]